MTKHYHENSPVHKRSYTATPDFEDPVRRRKTKDFGETKQRAAQQQAPLSEQELYREKQLELAREYAARHNPQPQKPQRSRAHSAAVNAYSRSTYEEKLARAHQEEQAKRAKQQQLHEQRAAKRAALAGRGTHSVAPAATFFESGRALLAMSIVIIVCLLIFILRFALGSGAISQTHALEAQLNEQQAQLTELTEQNTNMQQAMQGWQGTIDAYNKLKNGN